jgi:putative ABC transport system permease protein
MSTYSTTYVLMGIMSVTIGFAVIYNVSKVSLSERSRELATMRVLGLTVDETNEVIAFEHWLLSFFGMITGIPLAFAMRSALSSMMDTDLYTLPTRTPASAFILAALSCVCMVFLANRAVKGSVRKFDLVEVLKERE